MRRQGAGDDCHAGRPRWLGRRNRPVPASDLTADRALRIIAVDGEDGRGKLPEWEHRAGIALKVFVGLDVAKEVHWACAVDGDDRPVLSHSVANRPDETAAPVDETGALDADEVMVALELPGAAALLLSTRIAQPGLSVNRARQGMRDGEIKSDARDAATIAELTRTRPDLRPVDTERETDVDICLLIGRRSEIVRDQSLRLARLRDLLSSVFPARQRRTDVKIRTGAKTKTGLGFLSLHAAPHELRGA